MTCSRILRRSRTRQPATCFAGCLLLLTILGRPSAAVAETAGEYWKPQKPDAVIVTLADAGETGTAMNRLRHRLLADPDNATLAAHYATVSLKQYAATGDPRLLGYADGVLQPWAGDSSPPVAIWLLRGRLKQTQHQFAAAAADLEKLLELVPGEPQALTLAADARRRDGDIDTARGHCLSLQLAGHPLLARLCAADLLLSLGDFAKGYAIAQETAAQAGPGIPVEIRVWAWSIAGDAAFARQRFELAEAAYSNAVQLASPSLALQLAVTDLYIETERHADAWVLLNSLPPADAVQLRKAIVAARYKPGELPDIRRDLQRRLNGVDGDELHWREKALFALHVENNPRQAQVFAKRNWNVQKAWEDAALLRQTSAAAADNSGLELLQAWRQSQQSAAR